MTPDPIREDALVGAVQPDGLTQEFLDAADRGVFLIKRGPAGAALEPMAQTCPETGSADLVWEPAAGGASLVSWTSVDAGEAGTVVLAIGELDEGPWWWARIADADPARLVPGQRLRIVFRRPAGGGHSIPIYTLDEHGGQPMPDNDTPTPTGRADGAADRTPPGHPGWQGS